MAIATGSLAIPARTQHGASLLCVAAINAALFAAGLIIVLLVPALRAAALVWLPVVALTGFLLSGPICRWLASRADVPPPPPETVHLPDRRRPEVRDMQRS